MSTEKIDSVIIHTETMVKGFFNEYRWLSNYHICDIEYKGKMFTSTEAAYQSAKTDDDYLKSQFQLMTPTESKSFANKIKVRRDWDSIKKDAMYEILQYKFTKHADLKQKLILTGEKHLEETNYWGDTYYGVCNGKGKNVLGKLLMQIREELISDLKEKLPKD